eukprot:2389183-Ditylum_brightwellii.AAC.1
MGIKKVLNERGVNCSKHTIVQSSDLKEKLERCRLKQEEGAAKDKELSNKDVALAIVAYESAFLADIVASCIFEEAEEYFRECIYRGMYRDDGLVVFVGPRNKREIQEWLWKYQSL